MSTYWIRQARLVHSMKERKNERNKKVRKFLSNDKSFLVSYTRYVSYCYTFGLSNGAAVFVQRALFNTKYTYVAVYTGRHILYVCTTPQVLSLRVLSDMTGDATGSSTRYLVLNSTRSLVCYMDWTTGMILWPQSTGCSVCWRKNRLIWRTHTYMNTWTRRRNRRNTEHIMYHAPHRS